MQVKMLKEKERTKIKFKQLRFYNKSCSVPTKTKEVANGLG